MVIMSMSRALHTIARMSYNVAVILVEPAICRSNGRELQRISLSVATLLVWKAGYQDGVTRESDAKRR
jgi:hypothetical protein